MASATGIPGTNQARDETEPLLGQPGDVTQKPGEELYWNVVTGTGLLAQAGIWILAALVWSAVFEHEFMFFSYHPLLNSAGLLILTQSVLLLQPTATPRHKILGTYFHSILNLIAIGLLIAGLVVIEMNKASHPETRFQSIHGKLGLILYILMSIVALVGVAQFYFPKLVFGSVEKGKAVYKYHRVAGYAIILLALVTVGFIVDTQFNVNVLHMRLWPIVVSAVLIVLGLGARVKKSKFGF